ncbi:Glutamate racemase 1 [Methyloligella halotolerans]|uniref:Glutamate racemase n=1 Tax=Methyloligella halotolerans TaxID=1177755 RepID=A0A1E2RV02_9HYPH|nr:glutamate racemase [Methyloligella halotolerans]ODA65965.1 Glutamate racemase 1 [Methyloligella halotolerans]
MTQGDTRPIGVFDSGMGGLTVLRAMAERLPNERFVYLGDTARLPYGTKSPETIKAYALQATRLLLAEGVKMVVIACNTASSVAIGPLSDALAPIPVVGVIEPGAEAGVAASKNKHIAVLATESTVKGNAYVRAIHAISPETRVLQQPCQVFVAMAEEGWTDGPAARAAAEQYLSAVFAGEDAPDTLVLGCTHFPVLAKMLGEVAGPKVAIVDSARTTADAVAEALSRLGIESHEAPDADHAARIFATDSPERFARVGEIFLGRRLDADDIEQVDL